MILNCLRKSEKIFKSLLLSSKKILKRSRVLVWALRLTKKILKRSRKILKRSRFLVWALSLMNRMLPPYSPKSSTFVKFSTFVQYLSVSLGFLESIRRAFNSLYKVLRKLSQRKRLNYELNALYDQGLAPDGAVISTVVVLNAIDFEDIREFLCVNPAVRTVIMQRGFIGDFEESVLELKIRLGREVVFTDLYNFLDEIFISTPYCEYDFSECFKLMDDLSIEKNIPAECMSIWPYHAADVYRSEIKDAATLEAYCADNLDKVYVLGDLRFLTLEEVRNYYRIHYNKFLKSTIELAAIYYEMFGKKIKIGRHDFLEKVGSSRVDLQACKLEYSIVSPK